MNNVIPFKAFLYNSRFKKDFATLLSPPYDIIYPEMHESLLRSNPYNSVRLCLTADPNDRDRYQKVAELYQAWKKESILEQAEKPAFYFIRDEFQKEGRTQIRYGFVGLLELQEFGKGQVFPHEYTLSGPKQDRLSLLEEMGAELSQIFFCFRDPDLQIDSIFRRLEETPAHFEGADSLGVQRSLWLVEDKPSLDLISTLLNNSDLLIADGHHRYETALENRKKNPNGKGNFVQAYFTNSMSPGFSILPIHRLFKLPESRSREGLFDHLQSVGFEITEKDSHELSALTKMDGDNIAFGLCFSQGNKRLKISRPKRNPLETALEGAQKDIFELGFGWSPEELKKGLLTYEHTDEKFLEALKKDPLQLGIYLPACTFNQIMDVVKTGQRMPQKSTFFAPKIASGLVIYELGKV